MGLPLPEPCKHLAPDNLDPGPLPAIDKLPVLDAHRAAFLVKASAAR